MSVVSFVFPAAPHFSDGFVGCTREGEVVLRIDRQRYQLRNEQLIVHLYDEPSGDPLGFYDPNHWLAPLAPCLPEIPIVDSAGFSASSV